MNTRSMKKRLSAPAKWLIGGATTHALAETFYDLAMPLLILALTGSPTLMAVMFAVGFAAEFIVAIIGGSLVDRFPRRALLAAVVFGEAALMASFGAVSLLSSLPAWIVILGAAIFDFSVRLYGIADAAALPQVVETPDLPRANGIMQSCSSTAQTLGPLLAGLTISLTNFGGVFMLTAALLVILLISLRYAHWSEEQLTEEQEAPQKVWQHMRAGVRFTFGNPLYRWLAIWRGVLDFALGASILMAVFFMSQVLEFASWEIGAASALMASGGVVGGLLFARVERVVPSHLLVTLTTAIMAAGFAVLGVTNHWITVGLTLASVMMTLSLLSRSMRLLFQSTVPANYLGRVTATSQLITTVFGPLSVLSAAWVSASGDVRTVFLATATTLAVLAISSRFGAMRSADWRVSTRAEAG